MKKLLTVFAVASAALSAGTAQAVGSGTFLLYGNNYNLKFSSTGVVKRQANATANSVSGTANLTAMPDGTKLTFNWTEGYTLGTVNPTNSWTNTAALNELNTTMGLSLTADDMNSLDFVGAASATTSVTLNFSKSLKGPNVTFYVLATSTKTAVSGLDITGLYDGYTVTTAADDLGSGFDNNKGGYNSMTVFKIEGTMDDSKKVTISTRKGNKGMLSMVSYATSVPEPSTATLSLLALAGLVARRRRK